LRSVLPILVFPAFPRHFRDLTLDGVFGCKDVELHAGELTMTVGKAADYGRVDTPAMAGDLEAPRL